MKKALITLFLIAPFSLFTQAQTKSKPKSKTPVQVARTSASIARGEKVYTQYCLSCHQVDGGGVQNMNPPLIKTTYVLGDKTRLIKVVLNGFAQSVDIDGESYSNNMAPHDFLKDQEIADVLTYVRNNFTNKASAVKLAEVKAVRAANKKK